MGGQLAPRWNHLLHEGMGFGQQGELVAAFIFCVHQDFPLLMLVGERTKKRIIVEYAFILPICCLDNSR